ncbi:MAG TPA: sensor histidine kinase [Puia sp.]|uniref:sensor histidine kinase n=1 Tax=Puia sp. TaxID=2045100 RepID=UPI002CEE8D22|nr:sensor histidine kinase [Puia sp.]HVU94485.1 sensor histidine kinase [Puia sp.]
MNKEDVQTQRLLLQLGSCYLNVARQNQIDIDSGLALAGQRMHLDPQLVIDESGVDGGPGRRGAIYAFRPASRPADLDSAIRNLDAARANLDWARDANRLYPIVTLLGKVYLEQGDTAKAAGVFLEVIRRAAGSGNKRAEALAWSYWGTYSAFLPTTIAARIERLERADTLYQQMGEIRSRIYTLSNIGYLSVAAGRPADSRKSFETALTLENSIGFRYTHYTLDLLCLNSIIAGDKESSVRYAIDEVRAAESTGDSTALAIIYARRMFVDQGRSDNKAELLDWGRKSLAVFARWGEGQQAYPIVFTVADLLAENGKQGEALQLMQNQVNASPPVNPAENAQAFLTLGDFYIQMDSLDKAKSYLLRAEKEKMKWSLKMGTLHEFLLNFLLGELFFRKGQFEKSRSYLNTALSYPMSESDFRRIGLAQKDLARIDSAAGRFKDAYLHAQRYVTLTDSFRARSDIRQVAELRAKYEIDKKDNNIKILNQQAALQEARNRQNLFTRNVVIAGAAALLLFLALLYNRFRVKQRANQQLEVQKSEISQTNAALQHLVQEKEWLLKEVHHRVKNNLHTVICLLESQARHLENDALKAIEISQHRIYAMSLIHQKLYQSADVKAIDMSEYLAEFIRYLRTSFDNSEKINFLLDVEPIELDVAQAVPLALIVNEAVTNSIKYAFPGERNGLIAIGMKQDAEGISLQIADNGVGIPPSLFTTPSASLGLKLIRGLSEDIGATLHIGNDNGTVIRIRFQAKFSKSGAGPEHPIIKKAIYV